MRKSDTKRHSNAGARWMGVVLSGLLLAGCQAPEVHRHRPILEERIEAPAPEALSPETSAEDRESGRARMAGPAEAINLDEAIGIALTNSPRLKAAQRDRRIAGEDIQVARSVFFPQISGQASYMVLNKDLKTGSDILLENQFWQAELDLQWLLWDFGRSLGRYHQARFADEIAAMNYHRFRESLIFQVAESYYQVLRAQKSKIIAIDTLASARQHLETARHLQAQDLVTADDVLRAEVQAAEFEQVLIRANNAIKISMSGLNRAMGIHVNWPTALRDTDERPVFTQSLDWALRQAIEYRAEFEQVQLGVALEKTGLQVAEADYLPQLVVSQSYLHIEDEGQLREDSTHGTLGIQLELFTGGRRGARVRQAEHKLAKSLETAKEVCDTIAYEVKQAFLGIEDAGARLSVAEKAVSAATENRRLVLEKYANHLATSTDVADAEAAYTQAQQNYYTALYDLQFAVERLHFAMGTNDTHHAIADTNS